AVAEFEGCAAEEVAQAEIVRSVADAQVANDCAGEADVVSGCEGYGPGRAEAGVGFAAQFDGRAGEGQAEAVFPLVIVTGGHAHEVRASPGQGDDAALSPPVVGRIPGRVRASVRALDLKIELAVGRVAHGVHGDDALVACLRAE